MSKIDYDLNIIKGIVFDVDGVLSPSTVPMAPDGGPARMVNVKDGYAMHYAARIGFPMAIISGGKGETLQLRYHNLGLKDVYLGCSKKLPVLEEWMAKHGFRPEEIAYVGDDLPDIPPMRVVGLPVAARDAAPEVKAIARYITRADGGYGVARELLEEILTVHGQWCAGDQALCW